MSPAKLSGSPRRASGDFESGLRIEQEKFGRSLRTRDAAGALRAVLAGKRSELAGT